MQATDFLSDLRRMRADYFANLAYPQGAVAQGLWQTGSSVPGPPLGKTPAPLESPFAGRGQVAPYLAAKRV